MVSFEIGNSEALPVPWKSYAALKVGNFGFGGCDATGGGGGGTLFFCGGAGAVFLVGLEGATGFCADGCWPNELGAGGGTFLCVVLCFCGAAW